MKTRFLLIALIASVLLGCSSSSESGEEISIAGTEWVSVDGGTTGDADEIISGEQRGSCFRIGVSKIEVFQTVTNRKVSKLSGIYSYEHPNLIIEMDNGALSKYRIENNAMDFAGGDESYGGLSFAKKMYLCVEGESTYEKTAVDILVGRKWKLNILTDEGSPYPFYDGIWENDSDREESLIKLNRENDFFTIEFAGSELNGELIGAKVSGKGAKVSICGSWNADSKSKDIALKLKASGTENDALGKVFFKGLQKVYKYEGDSHSLTLYFKDGDADRVIGFTSMN